MLYAKDTFVNPVAGEALRHAVPAGGTDDWVRVADASRYDRGGLLPMAVFLTKNAPGLRTSPVKRGNWVVKNVLGEKFRRRRPSCPNCRTTRRRWIAAARHAGPAPCRTPLRRLPRALRRAGAGV